jgi:predicted AlkP superfamily phosphohydrolase/phosphomutase
VSTPRLTVLGFDAATLDVIEPLIDAGELPNLASLLARGAHGTLRSTTHPLTPQAWSTMVTGVNAGQHGIWDFAERGESGYDLRIVNGSYRTAPALWDYLSASGRSVGLVNIPFTWPAPEVNGFAISGFDTAAHDEMTFPRDLLRDVVDSHAELVLDHKFPIARDGTIDLALVRRAIDRKVAITIELMERYAPELLFVVFMSADHVQHLAWNEWETRRERSPVADVYRILDDALGTFLDAVGADADVMIVSDHGAGSLDGVVNLNAWLEREGFLAYLDEPGAVRRLGRRALAARRKLLPARARNLVKRAAPELADRAARPSATRLIDMARTRAFSYGAFGNVVLNVRGREEQGIVEPGAEYQSVRAELKERLLELRAPGGERIVRAVHDRESLYEGPALDRAPDLIVEFDDYAWLGKGNLRRRTPAIWDEVEIESGSDYAYVGSHRPDGMVALAGPSVSRGVTLAAGIEDVAPTILYLLGEPVPSRFEGRVLTEALDATILDGRPIEYVDADEVGRQGVESYSSAEAVEVEGRLRSLGYLD